MRPIASLSMLFAVIVAVLVSSFSTSLIAATDAEQEGNDAHAVLAPFIEQEIVLGEAVAIADQQKHQILFYMGVILLLLVITTAVIGLQMALFGKQLFVSHMISAGLTVFLALAHAVTAIVWFFPFA